MQRPSPFLMFIATACSIGLMLWLITSVSAMPQVVSASAPAVQARLADPQAPVTKQAAAEPQITPTKKTAKKQPTRTPTPETDSLAGFAAQVADGQPGHLVGAYVPGLFALPVVDQPGGDANWVSEQDGVLTTYAAAQANGVTALLAHNNLSGRDFDKIQVGQQISLVYGDAAIQTYQVTARDEYQALDPRSPSSNFIDLANGGQLSSGDVFARYYAAGPALILQTCIEKDGDYYWGRLFLVAESME